jgi:hypothetical protein
VVTVTWRLAVAEFDTRVVKFAADSRVIELGDNKAGFGCRRWDSNPHWRAPKARASAVGLRRRW